MINCNELQEIDLVNQSFHNYKPKTVNDFINELEDIEKSLLPVMRHINTVIFTGLSYYGNYIYISTNSSHHSNKTYYLGSKATLSSLLNVIRTMKYDHHGNDAVLFGTENTDCVYYVSKIITYPLTSDGTKLLLPYLNNSNPSLLIDFTLRKEK